jgi:acetoin utilization deacetylase AcuC-like enzyme
MSTAFYSHAECRLHDMGTGHPECPQRLDAITDHLRATGLDIALDFHDAPDATLEQIERAHTAAYVLSCAR